MSESLDIDGYILGRTRDDAQPVTLKPKSLLRHMMALGSSGSGKTVLSKIVTEEFIRHGVPGICIDPQGDLCSLALYADDPEMLRAKGVDPVLAEDFKAKVDPVIFTPAARKGVAVCADPVNVDLNAYNATERIYAISVMASMLVSLLDYDLDSDDGEGLRAVFDTALTEMASTGDFPRNLDDVARWLANLGDTDRDRYSQFIGKRKLKEAARRMARLGVGAQRLLFHEGLPLSIDLLLGHGDLSASVEGKTRLAIVYLNTLHSQEDKEFFIAALTEQLYAWMLKNPSNDPQAFFYIDEVAPFIPPVRKPVCKPSLQMLFKQARKYGIGCLMATQNPADVDYKAMAQFGTWAIGRLTTRQDMKKVQPTVKSLDPVNVESIMAQLPTQKAGQFMLLSPDNFDDTVSMQTRWLYTKHKTLDDSAIRTLFDERWAERFDALEQRLTAEPEPEPDESPTPAKQLAADKPTPAKPSEPVDELAKWDEKLAKVPSATTAEFSKRARVSEGKARSLLKSLVADGRARVFKDGRSHRYWSLASELRPDLGLNGPVRCIAPRLSRRDAERIGQSIAHSKTLGVFGDDEELSNVGLCWLPVFQLSFQEKVTRVLWKRIFGRDHDEILDNVYLHPQSLKILVYNPSEGITLETKPEEYASRIEDFDGVAEFENQMPLRLKIVADQWLHRQPDDNVKAHFRDQFRAVPKRVSVVFLPVWELHLERKKKGGIRVVRIDALAGKSLDW